MEDYKKLTLKYERSQKTLRKENKILIKKIPYYIFGFLFFAIGLLMLLDGKLNEFVGNSFNLILIIAILFSIFSLVFLVLISIKTSRNKKEIKVLGNKLYKLMKL